MDERIRDACGVVLLADRSGEPRPEILPMTLAALRRLAHRGAVDADGRTGDGAGVLTQIPWPVLQPHLQSLGLGRQLIGAGMVFLPRRKGAALVARALVRKAIALQGALVAGWRDVPVDETALGEKARGCRPRMEQVFVVPRRPMTPDEFEECLFRARRAIDARAAAYGPEGLYVASLSHRTIVYKALVRSLDLAAFYPDLRRPEFATSFAIAHQRFSTNTFPSWAMAQPFRLIAHNGEINTIDGNRNWMRAREKHIVARFGEALPRKRNAREAVLSDSASLDEALSIVTMAGRPLSEAVSTLIPPAGAPLDPRMEPWDGPALIAFSDGRVTGAALDRNGLRPARYVVTRSNLLALASEAGVFDIAEEDVLQHARLGPGQSILVEDRQSCLSGREGQAGLPVLHSIDEVRFAASRHAPFINRGKEREPAPSLAVLRSFAYTREELNLILKPMYEEAAEPLASMGDDTPLAILSKRPRLLFSYFRQRFAQVTNPPIDSLRESAVMSLETRLGRIGNFLAPGDDDAPHVLLPDPLLKPVEVRALLSWPREGWSAVEYSLLFPVRLGEAGMAAALRRLLEVCASAVRDGATCLVLSDRGVGPHDAAIPSLLAVSAVHQHLIREGLRLDSSLIADAGDVRDDHQLAALLAFGADAVCPWVARATISDVVRQSGGDVDQARRNYHRALTKGLLKILAKMGVSTLQSYRGAQLFEALGLDRELVDAHFPGTPSPIGGLGLDDIARQVLERHAAAFASDAAALEEGGFYRYRRGGETHAYEPEVVKALHRAVKSGERADYRAYSEVVHAREPVVLRDLFELPAAPIPIDEVEPVSSIVRRFMTAAMSLGALSPEAQEVLATAMNRLGARSNSGEGGALPAQRHRIKQVASGRFGVTAEYLVDADELQIKIAQGSKPGEGGQLPGAKVTPLIAEVRRAAPGTTLISPPPHHDIYSIEDLAQLIYDLKQINRTATVSVKLVSSAGIGTIAVGVAKAMADAIEISGHDGGTGASPLGSIKNAGTPWELGLAEAHQALIRAGLRDRVRLQVNGGLKTGRDVVIAALLGADEFGFGTAALVAAGCVMARQCHLDTCPTGIATQREELRAKFRGTPENVMRFFTGVAEETREILASMGARSLGGLPSAQRQAGGPHYTRSEPSQTGDALDELILRHLHRDRELRLLLPISNADRAVGAHVAGHLVRHPHKLHITFRGTAGQSFGAFAVDGMTLELEGLANDGVGKGMSGGTIIIRGRSQRADDVLAGNAVLYGATGGHLYLAGRAGERFAVRNSGAHAVIEGTGDHACEYMTAGVVAILGTTGSNVAAGMTGGTLFLLDPQVEANELTADDESLLRAMLIAHREATGSRRAAMLLARWKTTRRRFRAIMPASMRANRFFGFTPSAGAKLPAR